MSHGLERILQLLDEALMHRPQPPVMTSRWRSQNSSSDVTECDKQFSNVMDAPKSCSTFYDDSLRPKSFLRDEVDEFNRVLAELLESRQRPEPLASEDDFACCCSMPEDYKVDVFQTTQQDCRQTNDVVNSDFQRQNVSDVRHASVRDVQPYVTRGTAELSDDDDDDDYVEVADDYTLLKIVEEGDCHPVAKSGNAHFLRDICTDDLFNEDDADSGYQSGNSTLVDPGQIPAQLGAHSQLKHRVDCYNANCRSSGLSMTIAPDSDEFRGFIRVHMNLHKPISVTSLPGDDVMTDTESFYLPPNTSKVIHINSEMTTPAVIQTLLDKFLITDACHKFALYEKINVEHPTTPEERRLSGMLRRLTNDEKPLQLCLRWSDDGGADSLNRRQFILQDNVTSEIAWDSFSLPELQAFLRILDREEESYCYQIQLKYGAKKKAVEMRLKQLADDRTGRA